MAYSPQLYIRPAALTDLTITLTRNDEVVETWTLNDFVLIQDSYWQGTITYELRTDIITIESTGYQTQTIEIHWLTDYNITLNPVEFSNIETNSIKYYCKDVVARDSITDIETTLAEKVNTADIWYDSSTSTLYIGVAQPSGEIL